MKLDKQIQHLKSRKGLQKLKDQGGFLAADFLFSFILAALVSMMLFAMSTTYTVVEISQYIAFSAARAHASANLDYQTQQKLARDKFAKLVNDKVLAPLYRNGWFELGIEDVRSGKGGNGNDFQLDGKNFADDYSGQGAAKIPQVGIRLQLNAKLLNFKVGPLGSSDPEGNGFKTKITGLLIREPTWTECWGQMKRDTRYKAILKLDERRYQNIAGKTQISFVPMEDNGC